MNTFGAWQEEFAWLVQLGFGYSVPTFLFKYGRILLSPFFEWRQEKYVKRFIVDFESKAASLTRHGYTEPPDIIAHSFGTWIIARALETSAVRYGRVVLTGSIIAPDFPWTTYLGQRRVKAVLCHCGARDMWVRLAPFFIPRSGPSGVVGFSASCVRHVIAPSFGHSDFFADCHYSTNFGEVWIPFLTSGQPGHEADVRSQPMGIWQEHVGHRVGAVVKFLMVVAATGIVLLTLSALLVGTAIIWRSI
jgi:pimeloyl-ACP methyl ester carboxylesterase